MFVDDCGEAKERAFVGNWGSGERLGDARISYHGEIVEDACSDSSRTRHADMEAVCRWWSFATESCERSS